MSAVHLICGPPGSGKTRHLLDRYQVVARQALGAALWIGPTIRAVEAVRRRLAEETPGCLSPQAFTFQDFVEELIRWNDPDAKPLTHVHRRLIADDLVAELFGRGQLSHFHGVIDTRGFAEAVFALLAELKEQEIWAERFAEAVDHLANEGTLEATSLRKARQCSLLYRAYQEHLTKHGLYDLEGRFWRARDLLARKAFEPFTRVRAVFVAGFNGFTHTQHEILEALAKRCEELWISLPDDPADERDELFQRPRETRKHLERLRPKIEVLPSAAATKETVPPEDLSHVARELFRPLSSVQRLPAARGLCIIEAPGKVGEARLVARHIKELLWAGVPPDDIVVTLRELVPYVDLIQEVFAEYGIPLDVEGTEPLRRNPAVSTLLRALRLPAEGWPFGAVTALLRSTYLAPIWPATQGASEVIEQSEILLRLLGQSRGREAYLGAVQKWIENPPPRLEDEDADVARRALTQELATKCRAFLEEFFRAWDGAPERDTLTNQIAWVRRLADALGLSRRADEDLRDRAALARLWDELARWQKLDARLRGANRLVERTVFWRMLNALTAEAGLPRTPRGSGRVRVLSAELARHLRAPIVVIMGLGEGSFPRLVAPEPFFEEAERQAFRRVGLPFPSLADQLPEEMLLFYQLVTSARRRLILSYPAVDDKGQELLPSSFLERLSDCFEAKSIPIQSQRMLIAGYDRNEPLCPAEARVQQAIAMRGHSSGSIRGHGEVQQPLANVLAIAADVARQRLEDREHGIYDGLMRDPRVIGAIGEHFHSGKALSPTALENYIDCPFRFFLSKVLKLQPLEEPREDIESTERGTTFHRALSRLHTHLQAQGVHEPSPVVDEQLRERLGEAAEEYAKRGNEAAEALWQIEGRRLQRMAERYRPHWEKFIKPWLPQGFTPRPHWFEVSFGLLDADGKQTNSPLVIRADGIEVRISGRIDRVDIAELPDGGGVGFWIIDYKTGRGINYKGEDLKKFRRLQLTLYALAVEQVLMVDRHARPLGLAYWLVTDTGPKVALPANRKHLAWFNETAAWQAIREELQSWVVKIVSNIRLGRFPLKPRDEDCTATCDFGQICRISQARRAVARKTWNLRLPGE